jgi:hypothetical protein
MVEEYIQFQRTDIQMAEEHNCRVNTAEPAVISAKYHTIVTLATIDPKYPIQLWCKYIPQIETTLNPL